MSSTVITFPLTAKHKLKICQLMHLLFKGIEMAGRKKLESKETQNIQKKVIIYSTPTCHWCRLAKEFFREHKVEFTEHNVASNMIARNEMIEKSAQLGVPVIDIDGDIVIGFDRLRIMELLGIREQ